MTLKEIAFIDPTFLRYIHDGLNSGSIHAENASSLPDGLTGLYESSFLGDLNVKKSQQLLKRFACFSLLKKEVSCQFVAIAIEEPESEIIDFISTYSKWFNSAQAGKFSIYHERLRTYIISSISQHEFDEINNRIISLSQAALANRSNDEWEYYALEYLPNHLLFTSMISGNGDALKKLAYDKAHWNRQTEISKGFEWSKKMLNEMMQWAAKYDDDEVIECALNKVDLHHMEQNDAPRIVELVANNDIETVLQRIEAFGGNDKEGLQKKFILYMLCLMELTLLGSKDKPFKKEAIEKLLKHLDEKMPVDYSVLNWDDFFPSYLMFQMSCEWAELGLEYNLVYERTFSWDGYWIDDLGFISDIDLIVIENLISYIKDERIKKEIGNKFNETTNNLKSNSKTKSTIRIPEEESNENKSNDDFISIINEIDNTIDSYDKTTKLINLGYQILKFIPNGNIDSVISDILESINKIDEGEDAILKCYAYSDFSGLLFKSGKIKESDEILNKAICLFSLINVFDRLEAVRCVGREIVLECKFDLLGVINRHVLEIAHQLNDDWFDYLGTSEEGMIESVLYELRLKGDFELIEKIILEQYYLNQLTSLNKFIYKWHSLSGELDKLNSIFINSVRCFKITEKEQNFHLYKIALIFISIGDLEKPLSIINYLSDTSQKTSLYTKIGIEYFKRGNDNLVDDLATRININDERFDYYRSIILYFISNNVDTKKIKKYISQLDQLIINKFNNDDFIKMIISLYIEIGELFIALEYSKKIWDLDERNLTQVHISIEFAKLDKIDEALTCVNNLTDGYWKFSAMRGISAELAIQGKKQNSKNFLKEAFEYALKTSDFYKNSALEGVAIELDKIAIELAKKGNVEEAFQIVEQIIDESRKKRSLEAISIELAVQGKLENAFDIAIGIFDENYVPYGAFRKISIEFLKLNKLDTVLEFIKVKNNENLKNNIYSEISCEFAKLDKIDMAIENANLITSEYIKCDALQSISAELVKKENFKVAEYVTKYITQSKKRYECLELIGKNLFQTNGILSALNNIKEFSSIESENIIKCAIVNSINVTNINTEIAVQGCKDSHQEISSLEHLLQMQALNLLFFPSLSEEKIQRFNRTLNIQWAIDIKNSFSEN